MNDEQENRLLEIRRYVTVGDECWDTPTEKKLAGMCRELIEMVERWKREHAELIEDCLVTDRIFRSGA